LVSKTQLLSEGKAGGVEKAELHEVVHGVREHFSTANNAAIVQKMRILKPILEGPE
jgi:hypothetical protein